jgi:AcrR family transcriptional regulator
MPITKPPKAIRGGSRARIIDEAMRLVGERGYYGFGLQELADRCNMTKPGLLHHFGSKDRLLLELLCERDAANEAAAVALLGPIHDSRPLPVDARRIMIDTLRLIVERNAAQPELMRLQVILRAEAINKGHPAHGYFTAREHAKQAILAEGLTAFAAKPRGTARNLLAVLGGLEQEWLRDERGFDLVGESMAAIALLLTAEDGAARTAKR